MKSTTLTGVRGSNTNGATWDVVRYDEFDSGTDRVWIVDLDIGKSITNDAERVVKAMYMMFGNVHIYYRDTMGRWDELCHEQGEFTNFGVVPKYVVINAPEVRL